MKPKTLKIIFGMILLVGIVATGFASADRTIDDIDGIYIDNFVAGDTVRANFGYSYLRDRPENPDNSPLILRINITSSDEISFPVWRGDFEVSGFIERYILLGLIHIGDKHFNCSEKENQTIIHPIGAEDVHALNGTFYCYDPEGNLDFGDFNARDIIYLDITSHPALWPGSYDLTAELFYLPDIYPPFVNITNKDDFEKYYRELNNIEVRANIIDAGGISGAWGTIITPSQNISLEKGDPDNNIYPFTKILPIDIQEGNYSLKIFAEDTEGNIGEDYTTLRIDRTPPEIKLIEPIGGIFSEIIPIKFNVIDEKSGVDKDSVKVRLREIVNSQICPETGGKTGEGNFTCTTTKWIKLDYYEDNIFKKDINATELGLVSGEYWLDAVASDILGNKAEWIAGENE